MGARGTAPRSVRVARIFIYVSGGLAVIGGVVTSLALQLPQVAGLVAGVLWIYMASMTRTGRPWARLAAYVVFALGTLATVVEVLVEFAYQYDRLLPGLIVFEILQWLPALGAVLLLRTREATGYFGKLGERRAH